MKRRDFLKFMAIGGTSLAVPEAGVFSHLETVKKLKSNARIVIIGAGAGGLSVASKLSNNLEGVSITIIDKREKHYYQPGFTFIGCGLYGLSDITSENADFIPKEALWIKKNVVDFNPEQNTVTTHDGDKVLYDFLVISPGLQLNYSAIEGLEDSMLGSNGIGSIYHSGEKAIATWQQIQSFLSTGGQALFSVPNTPIKCGGAPLKAAFLSECRAREAGMRDKCNFLYYTSLPKLFPVPEYNSLCEQRFNEKSIQAHYNHVLVGIDYGKKIARFKTSESNEEIKYDYLHIVPPMSAPDFIKNSSLSCTEGKFAAGGWLNVDALSLQHRKYCNIFGLGDVIGTNFGKTAASVKKQSTILVANLINRIVYDNDYSNPYDGYTSCPLITEIGKAAIVEFDYNMKVLHTLPFNEVAVDSYAGWFIKYYFIRPMYFQMLKDGVVV